MSFFPSISNSQIQTDNSKINASRPPSLSVLRRTLTPLLGQTRTSSPSPPATLIPATLPFGPRGLITIQNGPPFPIGVIDRQDLFSECLLPTIISRDHEPCDL
ncbi:hypothetical protein M0R45_020181 [Rubus argutus]|uniref:Uncharacterized protein n=1 Tax=Rubus argutus TaxID=59490 RepID=A0AAW1X7K5_RUBAR